MLNRHSAKLKLSSELVFKLSLIKFRLALSFFKGGGADVYIKWSEGKKHHRNENDIKIQKE